MSWESVCGQRRGRARGGAVCIGEAAGPLMRAHVSFLKPELLKLKLVYFGSKWGYYA